MASNAALLNSLRVMQSFLKWSESVQERTKPQRKAGIERKFFKRRSTSLVGKKKVLREARIPEVGGPVPHHLVLLKGEPLDHPLAAVHKLAVEAFLAGAHGRSDKHGLRQPPCDG
uniref:Uncharacterized protein n=1 Tax=Micrurus lemniscatus lemniscatus TaxID=129467 RepID=A0A2D4JK69_MICLE